MLKVRGREAWSCPPLLHSRLLGLLRSGLLAAGLDSLLQQLSIQNYPF